MTIEPKKYAYVDALRGWAVLGVILVHTPQYLTTERLPGTVQRMVEHCALGVQLFFVMSAFTLAMSLHGRRGEPLRNFFIRRFFRIAPLYYCALAYYLWQDGLGPRYWLGNAPRITPANIASTVFFVNGFHPRWINSTVPGGWSIAVEMMFYALLPCLLYFANSTRRACAVFFACIAFSMAMTKLLGPRDLVGDAALWREYLYYFFPNQLPIFCVGLVLYWCVRHSTSDAQRAALPLLSLATLVIIGEHVTTRIPEHVAFGVGFACVAYCLSIYPTRTLVNSWTEFIGKLSFSLYLVHFAVLHFASRVFARPVIPIATADLTLKYVGCVAISMLVACITHKLIELPGQAVGATLIQRLNRSLAHSSPSVESTATLVR